MVLSVDYVGNVLPLSLKTVKKNKNNNYENNLINPIKSELKGVPRSYISFRAKEDELKLNLSEDGQRLYDDAIELAKNMNSKELTPAHFIKAAINNTYKNLDLIGEEVLDSGVIENVSSLSQIVNQFAKKNMLLDRESRENMLTYMEMLNTDNDEYLTKVVGVKDKDDNSELKMSEDLKKNLTNVQKETPIINSFMLLGASFNTMSKKNMYPSDFLNNIKRTSFYKNKTDIMQNYMKVYDNKALELWDKLAMGSNVAVVYDYKTESERLSASFAKTLHEVRHGNFNLKNTRIFQSSDKISDTDMINEIVLNEAIDPDTKKIYLVDFGSILNNSVVETENENQVQKIDLSSAIKNSSDNTRIVYLVSSSLYHALQKDPTTKILFDGFMTYKIPPIQTYETMPLLTKKNLLKVKTPFTKDAKERSIYYAGRMNGVFPDKAIDLMKRVSEYNSDKKKIVAKDVDDFAQLAHELFNNSDKEYEIVYDTGKTLANMYGKEVTKKDIEAIVKQIRTGRIGSRGLLIYSQDHEAGSGRTYIAETIAGEAKVPYVAINTANFAESKISNEGLVIDSPKSKISTVFEDIKNAARQNQYKTAVVYIDNFEEFAFSGPYFPGYKQAMGQLSEEMKKAVSEDVNILVIGSTVKEYASLIPQVIKGFNNSIVVDSPAFNKQSRKEILSNKIKDNNLPLSYKKVEDKEKMINKLVKLTEYMSFVEINSFIEKTKQIMFERNKNKASMGDFIEAYLQISTGRTSHPEMPEYDKKIITSHECGHATNLEVMNDILKRKGEPWHQHRDVKFITLDPRGGFLGAVFEGQSENSMYPFEALFTSLVCAYGGHSCEKRFFNMDGSHGISQDIQQATRATKYAVECLGMGAKTGKISKAGGLSSGEMSENVYSDARAILSNAEYVSNLITEVYQDFNRKFTEKYSKLIGSDDCMVTGDDFRTLLANWKKNLGEEAKSTIALMEDMILDIIEVSKKGKIYGQVKDLSKANRTVINKLIK